MTIELNNQELQLVGKALDYRSNKFMEMFTESKSAGEENMAKAALRASEESHNLKIKIENAIK